ncbi:MAG TPA: glycosyltransferase [Candidatus Udaeobacter sp.]|nr:glycosyltransferase [Candidatus Udaeobacter sp.]
MSARVFFYVQHLLGIGHLRRAALIARAMRQSGLDVDFISGGVHVANLDLAGARFLQLPSAVSADSGFSALLDATGRPIDDNWRARRRQILLDAFAVATPDLLLIEMFPFGRRAFAFELLPLIDAARAGGVPVAVSLRDILVAKSDRKRDQAIVALVRERIDLVLVHGDPALLRLEASFPAAGQIADKLAYTGYVAQSRPGSAEAAEGDEILVSAGGGAVGGPLLQAALAARPATRAAGFHWRFITGPNLPENEFAGLASRLPAGVTLERFRDDFPSLLARCRLSVSQAGYNTVMDILAAGARALVIPFAEAGEGEQSERARLLSARGLIGLMEPPAEAGRLASAIDAALDRPRPASSGIDLGGAGATARQILALLDR